jgi:hypothetical protein
MCLSLGRAGDPPTELALVAAMVLLIATTTMSVHVVVRERWWGDRHARI